MPRRSWRDLTPGPAPAGSVGGGPSPPGPPTDSDLLQRAAAGGSHLAGLLAERERLESQLSGLVGPASTDAGNATTTADARFPVTGLRERRAEIASWADARDARAAARAAAAPPGEARRGEGTGSSEPELGTLTGAGAELRSQLAGPLRSGLGRYDQVRSALDRSDEFFARPQQLAAGLERRRQQAEDLMTGPLDRIGSYAEARDRVLDVDSGGSGDLFARAEAARRRALERRSALDREERRAAQRHERHHARRRAEQQDTERLDRRSTAEKGV